MLDLGTVASRDAVGVSARGHRAIVRRVDLEAVSRGLSPGGVARQVCEQVQAGGFEFLADEAQAQEPASEGVLRVVGLRARCAGRLGGQGLCAHGQAKLDVGLDLPGVEGRVEGAELDGVCRALRGEGRVEVEQVVAAVVVVCRRAVAPVVAAATAVPVPNPGEGLEAGGLLVVERPQEGGLDRCAPLHAAAGRNAQGLCQEVFLGVHNVDQAAQALRRVLAEADVDVDAAGAVDAGSGFPDRPDHRLHHLDVFPAAHRADHLRRGVGDRAVALDHPLAPVGHRDVPVAQVVAHVAGLCAEVGGDRAGCAFAPQAGRFDLDTEGLVFHGFLPARRLFPPAARPGVCPAA